MAYGNYGRRRSFRRPYRRYGQKKIRMVAKSSLLRKRHSKPVTGIPLIKRMKFKKEILINYDPVVLFGTGGATATAGTVVSIPCQNPNPGGVQYFRTNSANSYWTDNLGCAGISEWFAFYNSMFVRGCKMKAELVNNSVDPLVVDCFPSLGWDAGNPLNDGSTTFESYGIDPNEIPLNRRTFMGGVNSTNKGFIKNYVNVRKMLGVKDLEDVLNGPAGPAEGSEFVPQVPIITSASDTDGQSTLSGGALWLNMVFRRPNYVAGVPQSPNPTVRMVLTYYVEFRSRKVLSGAN